MKAILLVLPAFYASLAFAQIDPVAVVNDSKVVSARAEFPTVDYAWNRETVAIENLKSVGMVQEDGTPVSIFFDWFGSDLEVDIQIGTQKSFTVSEESGRLIWMLVLQKARSARVELSTLPEFPEYPLLSKAVIQDVVFEKAPAGNGQELSPVYYNLLTEDGKKIGVGMDWFGSDLDLEFQEGERYWDIGNELAKTIHRELLSRALKIRRNFISLNEQQNFLNSEYPTVAVEFVTAEDVRKDCALRAIRSR